MNKRNVTIKDIAKALKTTPSTVSRALNNHPRISQKTKNKIIKIAQKMGYSPSLLARGLVKKKTYLIGLLVFDFRNYFYSELVHSIQEKADDLGYWVIMASTDDDSEKTHSLLKSMVQIGVEGIIFAATTLNDPVVENLIDNQFPIVLTNRKLKKDKGDQIVLDNKYGGYLIVNHLIRLGYQRIGMIRGPVNLSTCQDRYKGYMEALAEKKLEIDKEIVEIGLLDQKTGYRYAQKMMRLSNPPEAIFCCDDNIALGAMKAIGEIGLQVPDQVALVGFDDVEIASHSLIQLTTISQNTNDMGRLAAQTIIDRIEGRLHSQQKILIEPRLVIRQSCGYKMNLANIRLETG